eukprot:gene9719-11347_t
MSGYGRDELLGQNHRILSSGLHPAGFFQGMWQAISEGRVWRGEICNRAKDGTLYWVDSTMVPLLDEKTGRVQKYVSIRFDMHRWQVHGHWWSVSVNIAARHFQREDFVERLQDLLAQYPQVEPHRLDLEIAESVAIDNIQRVTQHLDWQKLE